MATLLPNRARVLVLAPDDTVPPATPIGTVILRVAGPPGPAGLSRLLLLDATEPVPEGYPAGTVILRTE